MAGMWHTDACEPDFATNLKRRGKIDHCHSTAGGLGEKQNNKIPVGSKSSWEPDRLIRTGMDVDGGFWRERP